MKSKGSGIARGDPGDELPAGRAVFVDSRKSSWIKDIKSGKT